MKAEPYAAAEDSAFLTEVLSSYSGSTCLEIGTGNGGALPRLAERFSLVVGTDIIRPGPSGWSRAGANLLLTDLASPFRPGTFDLVAFNPPYLATEAVEDTATDGGRVMEVPLAFLREALRVVRREGVVLMLLNQDAPIDLFETRCLDSGFALRQVATKHLFYEELAIYEARADGALAENPLVPEVRPRP